MRGMDRNTGVFISDLEHVKQSIIDILSTPIGSRVLCREYGSNLYKLLDEPVNQYLYSKIYAAVAEALQKWEPRISVEKITLLNVKEGKLEMKIEATYLITQQKISSTVSI